MRSTVEEREVGVAVQLGVRHRRRVGTQQRLGEIGLGRWQVRLALAAPRRAIAARVPRRRTRGATVFAARPVGGAVGERCFQLPPRHVRVVEPHRSSHSIEHPFDSSMRVFPSHGGPNECFRARAVGAPKHSSGFRGDGKVGAAYDVADRDRHVGVPRAVRRRAPPCVWLPGPTLRQRGHRRGPDGRDLHGSRRGTAQQQRRRQREPAGPEHRLADRHRPPQVDRPLETHRASQGRARRTVGRHGRSTIPPTRQSRSPLPKQC